MQELRLYCFTNFYLSSIQQGVQTGHAAVDLVRKYTKDYGKTANEITPTQTSMVERWADNFKTFIILNGGNNASILAATKIISKSYFPWVTFNEDEQSLGSIQTCVGVLLPENIFNAKANKLNGEIINFEYIDNNKNIRIISIYDENFELVKLVKTASLAK